MDILYLWYGTGIGWIFEVFVKKSKFSLCNKAATREETKKTPRYGPLPPPPGTGSREAQQYRSCPHLSSCSNPRRHANIQQKIWWRLETSREDSVHPAHKGFLQTPSEHPGIFMGENTVLRSKVSFSSDWPWYFPLWTSRVMLTNVKCIRYPRQMSEFRRLLFKLPVSVFSTSEGKWSGFLIIIFFIRILFLRVERQMPLVRHPSPGKQCFSLFTAQLKCCLCFHVKKIGKSLQEV